MKIYIIIMELTTGFHQNEAYWYCWWPRPSVKKWKNNILSIYKIPNKMDFTIEITKYDETNTTNIQVTFSNGKIYNTQVHNRKYDGDTRGFIPLAVFKIVKKEFEKELEINYQRHLWKRIYIKIRWKTKKWNNIDRKTDRKGKRDIGREKYQRLYSNKARASASA